MSNFSAVDYLSTQVDPNTGLDSPSVEFISKFIQPRKQGNYGTSNQNLGIDGGLDSYTEYLGQDINPHAGDINERRAQAQTAGERWLNAGIRFVPAVVGKTLQSAGNILGLPGAAITQDVNAMIDNPIVNLGRYLEESVDDMNPIYARRQYTEGSFLDKIGTSEFWTIDGMDGVEFLTSAWITSLGAAGGVNKALGSKGLKTALTKGNKAIKTSLADDFAKASTSSPEQILYNTKFATTTALNTIGEAGIEAREVRDQLLGQGVSMEIASKAASDAAVLNVGALLLSNAWQTRLFMGNPVNRVARMKKVQKSYNKLHNRPVGTTLTNKQFEEGLKGMKNGLGRELLKQGGISSVIEGGWEENVQTAIQKVTDHAATSRPDFLNENAFMMAGAIGTQMIRNFSETEGQTAIFLGALLGLAGASFSSVRDVKNKRGMDATILESIQASDAMNMENLFSFIKKSDKEGETFEVDEDGNPVVDAKQSSLLLFKMLDDKSLYDDAMAAMANEDEATAKILSQMVLARDFFRHSASKEDIEFFKAKKDILTVADEEGFEGQIKQFQRKYIDKLSKLATVTRDVAPVKGIPQEIDDRVKAGLYYYGSLQFIVDELINDEKGKVSNTGTALDKDFNGKIDKRLEYLATLKKDLENRFAKLTDSDLIKKTYDDGGFSRDHLEGLVLEAKKIRGIIDGSTNDAEKEQLEKEFKKLELRLAYETFIDRSKYGRLYEKNNNNEPVRPQDRPPVTYDSTRDENNQVQQDPNVKQSDGLSRPDRAVKQVGDAFALRQQIRDDIANIDKLDDATFAKKIDAIYKFINSMIEHTANPDFMYVGDSSNDLDIIRALKNDITAMEQAVLEFQAQLAEIAEDLGDGAISIDQAFEQIVATEPMLGRILQKSPEVIQKELEAAETPKAASEIVYGYAKQIHIRNNFKSYQTAKELIDQIVENFVKKETQFNENSNFNQQLRDGGIHAFDNYFDTLYSEEQIEILTSKLESYLDANALHLSSHIEHDISIILGAIEYYKHRITRESANKQDAERLLKEFQDLLTPYKAALKLIKESEQRNEQKLKRISSDIKQEKWNGLGRDENGKVIDEEIDEFLRDALPGDGTESETETPPTPKEIDDYNQEKAKKEKEIAEAEALLKDLEEQQKNEPEVKFSWDKLNEQSLEVLEKKLIEAEDDLIGIINNKNEAELPRQESKIEALKAKIKQKKLEKEKESETVEEGTQKQEAIIKRDEELALYDMSVEELSKLPTSVKIRFLIASAIAINRIKDSGQKLVDFLDKNRSFVYDRNSPDQVHKRRMAVSIAEEAVKLGIAKGWKVGELRTAIKYYNRVEANKLKIQDEYNQEIEKIESKKESKKEEAPREDTKPIVTEEEKEPTEDEEVVAALKAEIEELEKAEKEFEKNKEKEAERQNRKLEVLKRFIRRAKTLKRLELLVNQINQENRMTPEISDLVSKKREELTKKEQPKN